MGVGEADALRVEGVSLNHAAHFAHLGDLDLAQLIHSAELLPAISQGAQRDLSDDARVHRDFSPVEEIPHLRVGSVEVVDPD